MSSLHREAQNRIHLILEMLDTLRNKRSRWWVRLAYLGEIRSQLGALSKLIRTMESDEP